MPKIKYPSIVSALNVYYTCIKKTPNPIWDVVISIIVRERPFNMKGDGYGFFWKKYHANTVCFKIDFLEAKNTLLDNCTKSILEKTTPTRLHFLPQEKSKAQH